ncbi:MAG: hypothetical protein ACXVB0_11205 [Mucilaginibacter sp.]
MKKSLLTSLICLHTLFCFSQNFPKKQTLIPLSNVNGVPFFKDEELNDLVINGFEVDNAGYFYFRGGNNGQSLAVFSGNKQVFRKTYKECLDCQLYIYKDTLYTFNRQNNDLILLNKSNGLLIKKYAHIISKPINSYKFTDNSLVIELSGDSKLTYEQYTLFGKFLKQVPNDSAIAQSIIPGKDKDLAQFLGKWGNNYVFWDLVDEKDSQIQKFWLVDKDGTVLSTKSLINRNNVFGSSYVDNPDEHRKVRNGKLYVLGHSRTGNFALITEVPLQSFFFK